MRSDEELMRDYIAGDLGALTDIFRRHGPKLTGLMRRQLPTEQDAADLVQQTFLQLHRARYDFKEGAKLRPWLYTIAMNLKREHFRRRSRWQERELAPDLADDALLQNGALERKRRRVEVQKALGGLPEEQRQVIELHWFDGLSFPEIARLLGLGVSAVKVRAHRGYKVLRQNLEKVGN